MAHSFVFTQITTYLNIQFNHYTDMKRSLILVAAGRGVRAGGDVPKQFRKIGSLLAYQHALLAFAKAGTHSAVIVADKSMHSSILEECKAMHLEQYGLTEIITAQGGETRWHSVKNGLSALNDITDSDLVAVHDSARPLVSASMIENGWEAALRLKAVVPVVAVTDSLRIKCENGTKAVERSKFLAVQTPQIFEAGLLRKAYAQDFNEAFTDDASLVEAMGRSVGTYPGEPSNIKITNPDDFIIASVKLSRSDSI